MLGFQEKRTDLHKRYAYPSPELYGGRHAAAVSSDSLCPFLAPSFARLPPLAYLLADQTESRKTIARHLGVSLRTLQRYQASGNAPRAIYLALWFESRWGMAALHAQVFNEAQHARAWVASLERECERLRRVITNTPRHSRPPTHPPTTRSSQGLRGDLGVQVRSTRAHGLSALHGRMVECCDVIQLNYNGSVVPNLEAGHGRKRIGTDPHRR